MVKRKKNSLVSGMLLLSQALTVKRLGNCLGKHRSLALKHLPDKEELVEKVFKRCLIIMLAMKINKPAREKIFSMLEFPLKNKWTTFLDKLSTLSDQNTLGILLFKTLVQELISKEKVCRPFWTPAFKGLSEKLLLHTETDLAVLGSSSSNSLSKKVVEKSPFLTITETNHHMPNCQKISCQSFMSSIVEKWGKEVIKPVKLRTLKVKLYPSIHQKQHLENIINVHRSVYNKTLEYIKRNGNTSINYYNLRNVLVTKETRLNDPGYENFKKKIETAKKKLKDDPKNQELKNELESAKEDMKSISLVKNDIPDYELSVHKDIRAGAIKTVCDAYKTGFSNLKAGNIKYFNMSFKKKSEPRKCVELDKACLGIKDGKVSICPRFLKEDSLFKVSKRNSKKLVGMKCLKHNCDLVRQKSIYYLFITVPTVEKTNEFKGDAVGCDPGVRTLLTTYSTNSCVREYNHSYEILNKLNKKIDALKKLRTRKCFPAINKKHLRKKQFNKIEKKKIDFTDSLHWSVINHLIKNNDVIFMGDIKSHDIVKNGKNKTLNRNFNDLKFYIFKTRLAYKASINGRKCIFVPEHYTTQGCSQCGALNKEIGSSKIFYCKKCGSVFGRDVNSAKNILMKGLISNL